MKFLNCHHSNEGHKKCMENLTLQYRITQSFSWTFLIILHGLETLQFLGKLFTCRVMEYITVQNTFEVFMFVNGQAFFVLQTFGRDQVGDPKYLQFFLGWTVFFVWIDFTAYLGRINICGKHIYRSWYVIKNVAFSMVMYVPIMIAFAGGFHCFLIYSEVFEGPVASLIKVLTMIFGEFDYQGNFLYDNVEKNKGSKASVQILLILLMIYGSLIIMNLITAWIVVCHHTIDESQVILEKQRIEEISGVTGIRDFLDRFYKQKEYEIPSKVSMTTLDNKESISWRKHPRFHLTSLLDDEIDCKLCIIKAHEDNKSHFKSLKVYVINLADNTEKMLKEKEAKQLALAETVKKTRKETNMKLKQLSDNKDERDFQSCFESIPDGCAFQYLVYKSPDGTLKRIQTEVDNEL